MSSYFSHYFQTDKTNTGCNIISKIVEVIALVAFIIKMSNKKRQINTQVLNELWLVEVLVFSI